MSGKHVMNYTCIYTMQDKSIQIDLISASGFVEAYRYASEKAFTMKALDVEIREEPLIQGSAIDAYFKSERRN